MNPKTLKALKGSIKKWEGIVAGDVIDEGYKNCPLCQLFSQRNEMLSCEGCPVSEKTGVDACQKSPYEEWDKAEGQFHTADNPKRLRAAKAELRFLKRLLPKARS